MYIFFFRYLDFVNVMAYDINNPTDNATGHNAPVHGNENNLQAIDVILKYWIGQGIKYLISLNITYIIFIKMLVVS